MQSFVFICDKIRKNTAREKLWEAQNGDGFICTSKGAFVSSTYRQQAYKKLTEAEKILRECEPFKESITSFDYTGDGIKDLIQRFKDNPEELKIMYAECNVFLQLYQERVVP